MSKEFDEFKKKINDIVSDLINEGTYEDFLSLQDSNTCADYTIFLEDELLSKFKKVELKNVAKTIFVRKSRDKKCSTDECKEIQDEQYGDTKKTKADLCADISLFYVRILNILAAIFVALNPDNNMCVRRINALYKPIDESKGVASVCNSDKLLYPNKFLKVEGMSELLKLYSIYDVENSEKENETRRLELVKLQETLKEFFKDTQSDIDDSNNNNAPENVENEESALRKRVSNNIERIRNNIDSLKGNVNIIKTKINLENNNSGIEQVNVQNNQQSEEVNQSQINENSPVN